MCSFADVDVTPANGTHTNGPHTNGYSGNGEVQLSVREMIDVPSHSEEPKLERQDREAFSEAGVLEKEHSLKPGDRLPPQPLVKTLEEVADKLGEPLTILS